MLSALIWIPVLGALIIAVLPAEIEASRIRQVALMFGAIALALTIALATQFDALSIGMQFQENIPWLDSLGLTYRLGVDGLSFPLLALSNLLTLVAIYCTDTTVQRPKFYYALILVLNMGVTGAFLSQNLLLFFLFYELELIPLYLLIGIWGGAKRGYAATKFLIYTAFSGVLILAAFL
ncbi:MAG: NAD(P)H-quinone oxidoreductase subunit D4, partial [Phormidesmis sp. CAN_BIN44]|nr:NAD(P)H-quinone oxidoreductase subunit D4 [Phormidesmis sp. CAN_BIN44]